MVYVKDPHQIRCSILPVIWTRAQFHQRHKNITAYTKELIEKNFVKSIDVDKEDVIHNWWWLVDRVFGKTDSERDKYMSQVKCPSFNEYWAGRDREAGVHEQSDSESFHRARRPTTRGERWNSPGAVYLARHGIETVIPDVDFLALKDVRYVSLVRNILKANPTREIALPEMQLLWDAVIYTIFWFECSCAKEAKLNESTGAGGLSPEEYMQLVSDVRNGVPAPEPRLLVTLPIPGSKRRRETDPTDGRSKSEDDLGAQENVWPASQTQTPEPMSKRPHLSSPGSDVSAGLRSTSGPEEQWLDPQLLNETALQANGKDVEESVSANPVLDLQNADKTVGDSSQEEDTETEIGAWSL